MDSHHATLPTRTERTPAMTANPKTAPATARLLAWLPGRLAALAAALAAVLLATTTHAATVTWNVAGDGDWDLTTGNWTGGSPTATLYVNSDSAIFNNPAGGVITIMGGGVSPTATTVSATAGTYTFTGGAITSGTLAKSNAGTLVLNSANSFAGTTSITGGTVRLLHGSALGTTAGNTSINNASTVELQGGITVAENFSLAQGAAGFNGNGALRNMSGTNTLSGTISIGAGGGTNRFRSESGLLVIGGTVQRGSGSGGDPGVTFDGDGDHEISGSGTLASDVSTLNKSGTGTLTLKTANSHNGTTTVSGGRLVIEHAGALGTGTQASITGGSLELVGGLTIADKLATIGVGGQLVHASGNGAWTGNVNANSNTSTSPSQVISQSGTLIINGVIGQSNNHYVLAFGGAGNIDVPGSIRVNSQSLTISKEGTGTLTLRGANSYNRTLTINGGTVSVTNGDTVNTTGDTVDGSNIVTIADTSTLAIGQSISGPGIPANAIVYRILNPTQFTMVVGNNSTSTTTPAAPATATGSGVSLTFGAWTSLTNQAVNLNDGTLELNGKTYTVGATTIGSAAGGVGTITAGSLNATGNYTAFAGNVAANLGETGGARTFTKNGTGTVTLTGANTFTGATTVSNGTLKLDFTGIGDSQSVLYNGVSAGALTMGGTSVLHLVGKNGAANAQSFASTTVSGNAGTRIIAEAGSGGSLAVTLGNLSRGSVNMSAIDFTGIGDVTFNSGSGSANTLIVSNNAAYATVNRNTWAIKNGANTAIVGAASGFYTDSTATTVNGHANLAVDTTLAANATINTVRFADNAARTLDLGSSLLTLNNGGILIADTVATAGSKIVGGRVASNTTSSSDSRELIVHQHSGQTFEIGSSLVGDSQGMRFTKAGPGTLLLSGNNVFGSTTSAWRLGTVSVAEGTLRVGHDYALGGDATGAQATNLAVRGTSILDLNGFDPRVRSFDGDSTATVTNSAAATTSTLTIGADGGTGTFAGLIENGAGTVALYKTGTGSITISNNSNSFSGGIEIAQGSIGLPSGTATSLGSSAVTLSGGQLNGGGSTTYFAGTLFMKTNTTSSLSNTQTLYLDGNMTGTGTLIQTSNNSKTLFLRGNNSAFAGTFVNTPALNPSSTGPNPNSVEFTSATAGSDAANWHLGNTTNINFADGILDLGNLSGTGTISKTGGGGTTVLRIGGRDEDGMFSGVLTQSNGSLALQKVGTGTLSLYGVNTHSGGTTVTAGTLNVATVAASISSTSSGASGQRVIQLATGEAANLVLRQSVTGTGIAASSFIDVIDYANDQIILNLNTTGAVSGALNFGALSGSIAGPVMVSANASLAGGGTVGAIGGAGSVDPGDSPGLLTAAQVDPTGGLDFNFEFTLKNAVPTWAAVENDVLRLTDPTTPFTAALDGNNVISLFLSNALYTGLVDGDVLYGGFYTDAGNTLADLLNAPILAYFQDDGGALEYNGLNYSPVSTEKPFGVSFALSMVANDQFADGGYLSMFTATVVIPEPTSLALLAVGVLGLLRRRR